jgi:dTDP-4-amino-4,6-dideoxygalactose transaminase
LRTHGITRDASKFINSTEFAAGQVVDENASYPGWYMEMQTLGYNYRFTDFQAALGISQLSRADKGIDKRRAIAKKYAEAFSNNKGIKGQSGNIEGHAYHLYVIEIEDRRGLYNYLRQYEIFAQIHYIPCHLMPYYRDFGWKNGDMPIAENYYKHCISLPMYPTLTDLEQDYVIEKVLSFLNM